MGEVSENEFFDHVTYNGMNVGKIAAEHLLSKGHRNLLYIGYRGNRNLSFMESVKAAGAHASEIFGEFIDESGKMQLPDVKNIGGAIEKMKRLPKIPTAVFAPADIIVIGLYHTLKHYDIVVGKDVEIVGVNNDYNILNHFTPRPASVDIHAEQVGARLWNCCSGG